MTNQKTTRYRVQYNSNFPGLFESTQEREIERIKSSINQFWRADKCDNIYLGKNHSVSYADVSTNSLKRNKL